MRTHTLRLVAPALGALAALGLAVATPAPAAAGELAGVTLPDRASAGDQELVLNGMALRSKLFIKVYVAGLYLPENETSAERVLAADTARRLTMRFLYSVDEDAICEAWTDGLEDNTPSPSAELRRQFETLCGWMEAVEKGEEMQFTYLPGAGTTVEVKGRNQGTIEGKAFADALFKSWIGERPGPGERFKKDLMGG